ncbi:MAG TPA: adenylate/guanylate cyclase domain-containing protein, partial [Gammaproteobacteria bacterium]|nr:adenylate/guanylate cyclase domain-containing protein [Gammaproteobacteria bacterium]
IDNGIQVAHLEKHVTDLVTQLQEELLKKESVIKTFQKYVPSEIVTRMINPEHDKQLFEGETIIISILFADIRNFVKIASQLTPKQTVAYLNKYFTIMSECIKNRSGTVDKFIGDGILALFGAPISYPENQKNSVLCALDMLEALKKFNDECRVELGFDTAIGIGINTGPAIVGNIGSDQYLEYTAIGDTVNMAARTEQLTKDMPNTILITQSTYDLVKEFVHAEKLESQFIKGKSEKIDVYKVTGKKTR